MSPFRTSIDVLKMSLYQSSGLLNIRHKISVSYLNLCLKFEGMLPIEKFKLFDLPTKLNVI